MFSIIFLKPGFIDSQSFMTFFIISGREPDTADSQLDDDLDELDRLRRRPVPVLHGPSDLRQQPLFCLGSTGSVRQPP